MIVYQMKDISSKAQKLLRKFDAACQNEAFKGAAHPDYREDITNHYKRTKQQFVQFIGTLESKRTK